MTSKAVNEAGLFDDSLVLPDGLGRPVLRWQPAVEERAQVLLVHGFGNHAKVFGHVGNTLQKDGYSALAYDQRGFGAARVKGKWPGAGKLLNDLVSVARAMQRERPRVPLFVLGESMGAGLAIIASARGLIAPKGVIACGPACREGPERRWVDRFTVTALSFVIPRKGLEITPETKHLAPEAAAFFNSDPHILRFASVSDYAGILKIADQTSSAVSALSGPVWFGYGEADEVIPKISFELAAEKLPDGSTIKNYRNGPHALLHWKDRDDVLDDICGWLNRHSTF